MKQNDKVPTRGDWGNLPDDDPDVLAAYKDFFGKSNDEMQRAFSDYVIEVADSLRWMPPVPFRYYILGFVDFILGEKFQKSDPSDAASSFLRLIEEKVRRQPEILAPVMDKIFSAVEFLANHQEDFEIDPDIYGDFREKRKIMEELWAGYTTR